jgi:hypothetical protein
LVTVLFSCKKDHVTDLNPGIPPGVYDNEGYDIILVIGQSNTHSGLGLDSILDASDSTVFQLGRFEDHNYKIIPATEPLEHLTYSSQKIGFALTFGKLYKGQKLVKGRKILIIPCGQGDTGFRKERWNKGDDLYEDAVARSNYVLKYHPNSKMSAMLWHQGEADLNNAGYQGALDAMIVNLRKDIRSTSTNVIPFILGGMVPYWIAQDQSRKVVNDIIKRTPERVSGCGFADPALPFLITKANNESDPIHFDAAGQREMGRRYYAAYLRF